MYLETNQSTRFYRLFFGLLRFVNERYIVNDDPLFGTYDITDPRRAKEVIDVLWDDAGIINEYLRENPDGLPFVDQETVSAFRHHITGQFVLYDIDGEYSVFIAGPHVFGVSGLACEINELVDRETLPGFVSTTLIPYDGKIVYDTIIEQMSIQFGEGMREIFRGEYDKAVKNEGVITDVRRFISIAREYAMQPKESAEVSNEGLPIPGSDEFKGELEKRLQIDMKAFSIRADMEQRYESLLFGDEAGYLFDVYGDAAEEMQPFGEMQWEQHKNKIRTDAVNGFCIKDHNNTSLYHVLKNQRVRELKYALKGYGIPGVSKLKKDEMIKLLIGKIGNEGFIKNIVLTANEEMLGLLTAIAKNGYVKYPAPEAIEVFIKYPRLTIFMCIYKEPGHYIFRAPDELIWHIQKYMAPEMVRKYSLYGTVASYAAALANLYGMVHIGDFAKIYNAQNDEKLGEDELLKIILELIAEDLCQDIIDVRNRAVVTLELAQDIEYMGYIEERHRLIEMFPMPEEKLLDYADPYYYEETDEAKLLYAYIKKELSPYHDDDDNFIEAAAFLDDLHEYARRDIAMDGILGLIEEYGFPLEESEIPTFIGLVYSVMNDSRKWANNGWTPNELYEKERLGQEAAKEKNPLDNVISLAQKRAAKTGRNDPCPCGSGKKYKNCCGKNLN